LVITILPVVHSSIAMGQVDLRYDQNETVTWQDAIKMYHWLDQQHEEARLVEAGWTDAGKPLHLFVISKEGEFSPAQIHKSGKSILFINNGIHPGEPCGVDASLKLAEGLLSGTDAYDQFLENTVVVIVPLFNIGGALNRSPFHRANQNGPLEQGFRGNARNLDLNRDFIKLDSKNTRSLVKILRDWDPHLFVDTHTSNGADYPYTITLINSHIQRHEPIQSEFLQTSLVPALFDAMETTPYQMSPYVWSMSRSPENGIRAFMDYPRYTSGYASLFNTIAFTVETHMFKPFSDRVLSTWHLLREILKYSSIHAADLATMKNKAEQEKMKREEFILQWELDTTRIQMIPFKGYGAKTKLSKVTGHPRQYYDRNDIWEKEIPYYKYFKPVSTVNAPEYYILPSAWSEVVERLQINQVLMQPLQVDTVMKVEVYYIDRFETVSQPYNGHYRHYDVAVRKEIQQVMLLAGDFIIPVRQKAIEYLVQTLEPRGYDSFFSWNFFDEILFRNEYFSPYIFEETAEKLLRDDPGLRHEFRMKQSEDSVFASNPYQQLRFIYERSPWSEKSYMRYPVYRVGQRSVK
jgi:murein tripeptide amidase MpaA